MSPPTVFVVDDDLRLRTAVSRLLSSAGLTVETFASADEFRRDIDPRRPGCLILDVRLPGSSGLELQDQLVENGYDLPVIFVTGHADVALAVRAMRAGALQVFTKPFDDQALLDAVHEALARDERHRATLRDLQELRERHGTLTAREQQVMTLVVTGRLNRQIAADLGTSEKTVKVHRAQVMRKMRADSVAELVRMADRLMSAPGASRFDR